MHAMIDCVIDIVGKNKLKPAEISAIKVFVEGFAEKPVWLSRQVENSHDAQFSMAHGIAVAAHLVPPGKAWMDPKVLFDPSVMGLMDRVTTEVHPDYVKLLISSPASRPARVELQARGQTFVGEKRYPKGSPSPEPDSRMTDEELVRKFVHNADGVLSPANADALANMVMSLEKTPNVAAVMKLAGRNVVAANKVSVSEPALVK
jgi:2-methylcitrate dehydratase PrpD